MFTELTHPQILAATVAQLLSETATPTDSTHRRQPAPSMLGTAASPGRVPGLSAQWPGAPHPAAHLFMVCENMSA